MIYNETYEQLFDLQEDTDNVMGKSTFFRYFMRAKVRDFMEKNKQSLKIMNAHIEKLTEQHIHKVLEGEGDEAKPVNKFIDAEHEKQYNESLQEFFKKPCRIEI